MTNTRRAAAAAALLLAASISGCGSSGDGDQEQAATNPAPAQSTPAPRVLPEGEYTARIDPVEEGKKNRWELWVKEDSIRVSTIDDGGEPFTTSLGFTSFKNDQVDIVVDPARMKTSDWTDPKCKAKGAVGSYRVEPVGPGVRFSLIKDPCHLRRSILAGNTFKP